MSTEKMREEFEAWFIENTARMDVWQRVAWNATKEALLLAWVDSRKAICVTLPKVRDFYGPSSECEEGYEVWAVQEAIESLGLKVKP